MTGDDALTVAVDNLPLEPIADPLSKAVRTLYESAGPAGGQAKNAMHGVWLGHPLHPVFTDIPIGAWTTALALDASANGDRGRREAATFAMGVGLLGAVGAAMTGLTDWSETDGRARREGLIHGLLNVGATLLMTAAFIARSRNRHDNGRALAWTGYAVALGSAYLGGDLVYARRVGVTHAVTDMPESFTRVASSADVPDETMRRARHDDTDVVLVRQHGRVCAMAHACTHFGGPLSEGTLKEGSVVCPWHGSEFALEDGAVRNGPATQNQPVLDVREEDGRIEVRGRAV